MNEDLNSLHAFVSTSFDVGNFEEFSAKMGTLEERKNFWDAMAVEDIDLGNYEEYESRLGKTTDSALNVTDSGSDDGSLELPKVTKEDVKVTEATAIKRLRNRFSGLGFDFKEAIPGGDYITIIAPADENGNRTEQTFSFDKGMLGGDIIPARLFGMTSIKKETEDINKFIQDNYKKGEVEKGIDANIDSATIKK